MSYRTGYKAAAAHKVAKPTRWKFLALRGAAIEEAQRVEYAGAKYAREDRAFYLGVARGYGRLAAQTSE